MCAVPVLAKATQAPQPVQIPVLTTCVSNLEVKFMSSGCRAGRLASQASLDGRCATARATLPSARCRPWLQPSETAEPVGFSAGLFATHGGCMKEEWNSGRFVQEKMNKRVDCGLWIEGGHERLWTSDGNLEKASE